MNPKIIFSYYCKNPNLIKSDLMINLKNPNYELEYKKQGINIIKSQKQIKIIKIHKNQ